MIGFSLCPSKYLKIVALPALRALTPFALQGCISDLLFKCQFIPHLPTAVKEKFHKSIPKVRLLLFSKIF
jgi:hypothetical protein